MNSWAGQFCAVKQLDTTCTCHSDLHVFCFVTNIGYLWSCTDSVFSLCFFDNRIVNIRWQNLQDIDLLCNAFQWHTLELNPTSKGLRKHWGNLSDKWDIWWYTTREQINYFIPWHRNNSSQHNQCKIRMVHDGKVKCNTFNYTMVSLNSDWV